MLLAIYDSFYSTFVSYFWTSDPSQAGAVAGQWELVCAAGAETEAEVWQGDEQEALPLGEAGRIWSKYLVGS